MKYIDLQAFMKIDAMLNFNTFSKRYTGGCDLYTCKPAGYIKKMHKRIEKSLQNSHRLLVENLAQMSPKMRAEHEPSANVDRITPFGSFHVRANRRKFAYLICTLKVTYPRFDLSFVLRPDDFRRVTVAETKRVINNQLLHARRPTVDDMSHGLCTPGGSPVWSAQMWDVIDEHIQLAHCEVYWWCPADSPFADEDTPLQRFDIFFYNKRLRRVCYLYLVVSSADLGVDSMDVRPDKRASYWVGHLTDTTSGQQGSSRGWEEYNDGDVTDDDDARVADDGYDAYDTADEADDDNVSLECHSVDEFVAHCDDDEEE